MSSNLFGFFQLLLNFFFCFCFLSDKPSLSLSDLTLIKMCDAFLVSSFISLSDTLTLSLSNCFGKQIVFSVLCNHQGSYPVVLAYFQIDLYHHIVFLLFNIIIDTLSIYFVFIFITNILFNSILNDVLAI